MKRLFSLTCSSRQYGTVTASVVAKDEAEAFFSLR